MSRDGMNSPDSFSTPYTDDNDQKFRGRDDETVHQRHTESERKIYDTPFPRSPSPMSSPRPSNDPPTTDMLERPRTSKGRSVEGRGDINDADDYEEEGRFDLTEDQRQAMLELQNERLDLGYTDTDPPEYDVTERIRQLNEELAMDPTPGLDEDDEREHSIKFKDDPVTLVVPPPEFEESEDELGFPKKNDEDKAKENEEEDNIVFEQKEQSQVKNEDKQLKESVIDTQSDTDEEVEEVPDEPQSVDKEDFPARMKTSSYTTSQDSDDAESIHEDEPGKSEATTSQTDCSTTTTRSSPETPKDKGQPVLVERNGKFELVDMKDLTPEERELYVMKKRDKHGSDSSKGSSHTSDKKSDGPRARDEPKPSVPSHYVQKNQPRQARSADAKRGQNTEGFEYQSPYGLTPEQKKQADQQKRSKERRKHDEKHRKYMEEQENRMRAEEVFQAWLREKQREIDDDKKKKRNNELRKREDKQRQKEEEDLYRRQMMSQWYNRKRQEKEFDRRMKDAERREQIQSAPSMQERQRAFKQWLRAKDEAKRQEKETLNSYAKINRLKSRKAHKSQQLAKAISFAQGYSYTDYYGYRF